MHVVREFHALCVRITLVGLHGTSPGFLVVEDWQTGKTRKVTRHFTSCFRRALATGTVMAQTLVRFTARGYYRWI